MLNTIRAPGTILLDDNKILIKIKNQRLVALVDSGAKCSCVDENLAKKLNFQPLRENGDPTFLYGANGNPMPVLGTVIMEINVQGLRLPASFRVIRNLTQKVILGTDFLEQNSAIIDLKNRIVSFYDHTVSVPFQTSSNIRRFYVRNGEATVIPPQCEAVIRGVVDTNYHNNVSLVEPVLGLTNKNLFLARTIVNPISGTIACRLLNPTNEGIFLNKGCPLATIEPLKLIKGSDYVNTIDNGTQSPSNSGSMKSADEILQDLGVKLDKEQMTPNDFETLSNFLVQNTDVFAKSLADLQSTDILEHHIDTGDAVPIRRPIYPTTPEAKKEISRQVAEMLDLGIIVPSTSPWSSSVLLVTKADGSQRFCLDYRALNKVTRPAYSFLANFTDVIQCLGESQPNIFSSLDLKAGYLQVKMAADSAPKTGFSCIEGHFEFTKMSFGLCNAPASFCQLMQSVLQRIQFKYCLSYLDDVLVWSRGMSQHIEHLTEVFARFRAAKLRMHPGKCHFGVKETHFLGHIISKEGIKCDPAKVRAVENFPRPHNVKTVRSFLGLSNYYRKYIEKFSEIAYPLHDLLKKDEKFNWTEDCETAFQTLKSRLTHAPCLKLPDLSKPFILSTDASNRSVSYILHQKDETGRLHPIFYGARALHGAEINYPTVEQEAIAILSGLKAYAPYLSNQPFTIQTDNISLTYIHSLKNAHGRLLRWSLMMQPFTFSIEHVKGKLNIAADVLSRVPYEDDKDEPDVEQFFQDSLLTVNLTTKEMDDISTTSRHKESIQVQFTYGTPAETPTSERLTTEEAYLAEHLPNLPEEPQIAVVTSTTTISSRDDFPDLQRECPDFQDMWEYIEHNVLPTDDKLARKITLTRDQYTILNDRLYHLYSPRHKATGDAYPVIRQLCIPRTLRRELLQSYHTDNMHLGTDRLFNTLRQLFYWPSLYSDSYSIAVDCMACQETKKMSRAAHAPLYSLPIQEVGDRIHIDIFGKLPTSTEGYSYILVVIESLSKFVELYPLRTQKASEITECLLNWVARYGMFKQLNSDAGRNLSGEVVTQFCKLFNITQVKTAIFRQQADSLAEGVNKHILEAFRLHCKKQTEWPSLLSPILMTLRSTVSNNSTGFSPYEILFGKKMKHCIDWQYAAELQAKPDISEYVTSLINRLHVIHDTAKANVAINRQTSKTYYDRGSKVPSFRVGDKVWMLNRRKKKGESRKWNPRYVGPLFIISQAGHNNYKLRFVDSEKCIKNLVNGDHLKAVIESADKDYLQPTRRSLQHGTDRQKAITSQMESRLRTNTAQHTQTAASAPTEAPFEPIKRILKRKHGKYLVEFLDGRKQWNSAHEVTDKAKSDFYGRPDRNLRSSRDNPGARASSASDTARHGHGDGRPPWS